jgi:hypothetical protein
MTDQSQEIVPQAPVNAINANQARAIKQAVLESYSRNYMQFMMTINSYPAHPILKQEAFRQFDIASCVIEKAIANMEIPQAPQQEAPQEQAQATEEAKAPEVNQAEVAPDSCS